VTIRSSSDAIVVLGDDDYPPIARRARPSCTARMAPVVVRADACGPYAGIAELEAHDLEADGVATKRRRAIPGAAEEPARKRSRSAVYSPARVAQRRIVTSNYHNPAARDSSSAGSCRRTVNRRVSAAPDTNYDPAGWLVLAPRDKAFSFECVSYCRALGIAVTPCGQSHLRYGASAVRAPVRDGNAR